MDPQLFNHTFFQLILKLNKNLIFIQAKTGFKSCLQDIKLACMKPRNGDSKDFIVISCPHIILFLVENRIIHGKGPSPRRILMGIRIGNKGPTIFLVFGGSPSKSHSYSNSNPHQLFLVDRYIFSAYFHVPF